ncbi:uncharacterized protein cubi_00203 [Cryptosporidium ubiquitum]|uniref:Cytoplasmic tRNA 2-thiolation protein 2 n=1 Tax=Cryptosporidium ubiquitum TaxID=857276 RepID=A0A1J4MK55_9CRYT|nr:uncharacterized protein cubi_00203 [Cryptosporidium ubiquitum]OII74650.1 hypothetical protein cubi_00203 [Cryptosporidium ubiquitum]
METVFCYKCKSKRAKVKTRFLSCIDCFNSYIEGNVRKEIRTGPIEKLKKLNSDYQLKKPQKLEFYVALGFGLSSQTLLNLLSVIPNTGKRPDYCIKSFINVDTSPLINKDSSEYYESVNSFIKSIYSHKVGANEYKTTPKLHIIPFCSSFTSGETKADKELRQKIIDEIKLHITRGTDYIKLFIQLVLLRDIKFYLDKIDNSKQKCLVLASTSDSMGSESLQYMTLASGIHIKSIYGHLDFRWPTEKSVFFLIRPLRNFTSKEVILYWKLNISKILNCSIGPEISINRSPIEDEVCKFIVSQNEKICNITHIFMKLKENNNEQHAICGEKKKSFCAFCGIICIKLIDYEYCKICYSLLKILNIFN